MCPLIWKALNYHGLDIPPHWYDKIELKVDEYHRIFNECVIELANVEGWPEYALYTLTKDYSRAGELLISGIPVLSSINNSFEDNKLKEYTEIFRTESKLYKLKSSYLMRKKYN